MSLSATDFSSTSPAVLCAPQTGAFAGPALGEAHALLRALSNITTDTILIKNSDGRVVFANPAAMRVFGRNAETIIGCTNRDLCTSSLDAGRMDANDRAVIADRLVATIEETVEFPGGARTFEFSRMPWLDRHGDILGVICIGHDITEHLRMERAFKLHETQLEELVDAETADARALIGYLEGHWEEEKSAIAGRLRHEFGSGLIALNLRLTMLLRQLPDDPEFIAQSERIRSLLDSVARAACRIHTSLHQDKLEMFDVRIAIAEYAAEFERRTGIGCRIDAHGDNPAYPQHISIALYRMVREALNAIAMRGTASRVELALDDTGERFILSIRENGRGLNGRMPAPGMTDGMRRMREHITCLGGVVKIAGVPPGGTELVVALPKPSGDTKRLRGRDLNDREC